MGSSYVEVYLHKGNYLRLTVHASGGKEAFMRVINLIKQLPVISYDTKYKFHKISLYYYQDMVAMLERKGVTIYVSGEVITAHKRLMKRIVSIKSPDKYTKPKLWTKDKDKQILKYQREAIEIFDRRPKYIVGDDLGIGKTIESLGVICRAFERGYNRALIVCLASLRYQWQEEILRFTTLTEKDVVVLGEPLNIKCKNGMMEEYNGRKKECRDCDDNESCKQLKYNPVKIRRTQLLKMKDTKMLIMNYDLLAKCVEQIKRGGFDIFVLDECTKVKNYNTAMTKAMFKIARAFKYEDIFIPMSGTLIENRIAEFFPVFSMLDSAIFGTWTNFKNRFLICDDWGKVLSIKNANKLKEITSKFIIRRTTDMVWEDRPELFEIMRRCKMSEIQSSIYKEIAIGKAKELRDKLEGKINKAELIALFQYMIMVADSAESVKDLGKYKPEDYSCKLGVLMQILENETNGKVVIFSRYANKIIPLIKRQLEQAKIGSVVIVGGLDGKVVQKRIKQFRDGKDIKVLLCSDTLTYGANLQFARYVINFDLPWNPAIIDQRIGRVYRKGQKHNVTVINIIADDTIEDYILDKIYEKREMFDCFIGRGIKPKSKLDEMSVKQLLKVLNA